MDEVRYGASAVIGSEAAFDGVRRRHRGLPLNRRFIAVGYLLAVHAVLALLMLKTDFAERLNRRLGAVLPVSEFDASYRRWAAAFARSDTYARPGALVFVGDSMLRDLDSSSMARHTLNLAIPGDTTARVLRRMAGYASVGTARGVVLGVGVNDLSRRPIPEIVGNYRRILALVPAGTPVLVLAVLPVDERARAAPRNAEIRSLNDRLAEICAARPGCRVVAPPPGLVDGTGGLAAGAHDGDGLHLSLRGHEAFWRSINAAVQEHVPPADVSAPPQ